MVAGQEKQVAWPKPFQQTRKLSIEIMEGCGRLCRTRFQDIESGKNQSAGNLIQHPRDLAE